MRKFFGWRPTPAPVLLAGVFAALMPAGPAAAEADAVRGGELAKRWCATCHVIDTHDAGTAVDTAPPFPSMAATSSDKLRAAMTGTHVQMPQLDLGRREVDDLIAYIRTLGAKK